MKRLKGNWQPGLLAGLCMLAISVAASSQQKTTEQPNLQPIMTALAQGQNDQALKLTGQALTQHPEDCKLLSLEGLAYSGLGQSDSALKAFKKASARCPTYLVALEGAAQIEYARKDPDVIPLLETILAANATDPTAHAMLASLLAEKGSCEKALPHFAASTALLPMRPDFQHQYGRCLAQIGNDEGALQQFQQIGLINPSAANTYNIALLQWKMHATKESLVSLEPLLSAKQFQPAFVLGARLCEELGDTPRAVGLLVTGIQLKPEDVEAYLIFSNIAYDHHSFPVGVEMLNAGLQRLPNVAPLYLARGVLEVQMSQIGEALADFETAHKLDKDLSFAVDAMGLVQTQQHQDAAARARFEHEVKLHPEDAFLQYLLAEQLSQSSTEGGADLKAAIAAASASTKLDPAYQPAQNLLIILLMRAKEPALAIEQAEHTLAQNPTDESALYQELLARRRLGQTELIGALTTRLIAARQANASKAERVDRYRLQGDSKK